MNSLIAIINLILKFLANILVMFSPEAKEKYKSILDQEKSDNSKYLEARKRILERSNKIQKVLKRNRRL